MRVKERIIALKLIESKKDHKDFLDEIGVDAEMKINSKDDIEKVYTVKKREKYE